jgi:hypothetical protein
MQSYCVFKEGNTSSTSVYVFCTKAMERCPVDGVNSKAAFPFSFLWLSPEEYRCQHVTEQNG